MASDRDSNSVPAKQASHLTFVCFSFYALGTVTALYYTELLCR